MSTDTETGMLPGVPGSAICVQKFDDSLYSAIRITYRISLRSSSLREPRHPSLKVVMSFLGFKLFPTKKASNNAQNLIKSGLLSGFSNKVMLYIQNI